MTQMVEIAFQLMQIESQSIFKSCSEYAKRIGFFQTGFGVCSLVEIVWMPMRYVSADVFGEIIRGAGNQSYK